MASLAREHAESNRNRRVTVLKTSDVRLLPGVDRFLQFGALAMLTLGGVVLLIVCANIAGMLIVRALERHKEFALRVALGASRGRLAQQILVESLVLSAIGAALGAALAWALVRLQGRATVTLPIQIGFDLSVDARVLAYTALVATMVGCVSALVPALRATRPNVLAAMKTQIGETSVGGRRWSLRDGLAILQLAFTMVLLVSAAFLARSVFAARDADLGFPVDGLTALTPALFSLNYDDVRTAEYYTRALDEIRALPGVQSAALTRRLPLAVSWTPNGVLVPGIQGPGDKPVFTETTVVSGDYFQTLGVRLVEGRDFRSSDTIGSPAVAIINQAMARRFWPNQTAIGKRFRVRAWDGQEYEVVGVCADYKVRTAGESATPYIHYAASQRSGAPQTIIARTRGSEQAITAAVRKILVTLEPNIVFVEFGTVRDQLQTTLLPTKAAAATVGVAALVAMLLAAIGLYGAVAYAIGRRTKEIVLRLALGATRTQVRWLVTRQGLMLTVIGLLVGALPSAGIAHALGKWLYPSNSGDWMVWAAAGGVLVVTSLLANDVPARRATRLDPAAAFRTE
jgi:predicted permease